MANVHSSARRSLVVAASILIVGCFNPDKPAIGESMTETSTGTDTNEASTSSSTAGTTNSGTTSTDPSTTSSATSGTTQATTTTIGGGTTGPGIACPEGSEGCLCGVGSSCDDGLDCTTDGICIEPGMVYIPAGPFEMGCNDQVDDECLSREVPGHTVTLDAYAIDLTPVTQAQYDECVQAGDCTAPAADYDPGTTPDLPVTQLNYPMARTYCMWADKGLPTEAQWEKAARGDDGRKYPWGNDPLDCNRANFSDCGGTLVDVGSYPTGASPYGLVDGVGNGGEWIRDWFDPDYYENSPGENPTGPASGSARVIRSQPPTAPASETRVSARRANVPATALAGVGVRCARGLPPLPEG